MLFSKLTRFLTSGWIPAGILFVSTIVTLNYFGVSFGETFIFTTYLALGITLPGVLLWRAVNRGSRSLVEDLAAGTAVGYALELLAYIPARAIDLPLLVLVAPAVVIGIFISFPGLRQYWRGSGAAGRAPTLWSWSMALIFGLLILWSAGKIFLRHGLTWPYNATPDPDMLFHLAIIGEVKHHMFPVIPFVQDERLLYHWFVYAEMAATSWVTGIEPQTLLYRLSLIPMLAAFVVMIAAIARRLTNQWWAGPVAVSITLFVLAPNPYGWQLPQFFTEYGFGTVDDGSLLRPVLWASTTQTFGALLFTPVVLLLIELFNARGSDIRRIVLLGFLLIAVMGAKATYLPLLIAAALFVLTIHGIFFRRLHRPALIAILMAVPCFLFAQFVIFGGATQGLKLEPFSTMKVWAMSSAVGMGNEDHFPVWGILVITALFMVCWLCIWGGIAGLGKKIVDSPILILLGLGLGGIGAITLFGHSGFSQGFFFQSARPYLAIAAVCGIATLVGRMTIRTGIWMSVAVIAGGVAVLAVRQVDGPATPAMRMGAIRVMAALVWPYLLFLAIVGVLVASIICMRRWQRSSTWLRSLPNISLAAVTIAMLAGGGLVSGANRLTYTTRNAWSHDWRAVTIAPRSIPDGAQEAGRWLRDHSSPNDLVATNAHCQVVGAATCDNEHVWISAYSERRVLVEGWAFTNTVHAKAVESGIVDGKVPYWHPEVLADNDVVFANPSMENVARLRDYYGVRWLFVDERDTVSLSRMGEFASFLYRAGSCSIYELHR